MSKLKIYTLVIFGKIYSVTVYHIYSSVPPPPPTLDTSGLAKSPGVTMCTN